MLLPSKSNGKVQTASFVDLRGLTNRRYSSNFSFALGPSYACGGDMYLGESSLIIPVGLT